MNPINNTPSRLGNIILLLAVLAVLAAGVMMFGARLGLWQPIVGFGLVRTYLNPIGYAVTGFGIAGLIYLVIQRCRCGAIKAGIAVLLGLGLLAPMIVSTIQPPVRFPPIHDITTDTTNPPEFLVLDETRPGARNSLVYGGPEIAKLQHGAFPDIAPIQSDLSPKDAYAKALRIGQDIGWTIIAQDPDALRFEATARTRVYHFADDIVVVVQQQADASRIDIRSVSRIGRGDRGVNATRIRRFSDAVTN